MIRESNLNFSYHDAFNRKLKKQNFSKLALGSLVFKMILSRKKRKNKQLPKEGRRCIFIKSEAMNEDLGGIMNLSLSISSVTGCWCGLRKYVLLISEALLFAKTILTYFISLISFHTPWKQKTSGFAMFAGGIERDR